MVHWLNTNASAVTAGATVALVFITGIYVWFTSRLASGGNETNESLQAVAKALNKSIEQQAEVITALKRGQGLQDEANLMKFYEIIGTTGINKAGFDKALPHHYEKWQEHQVSKKV